MSAIVDQRVDPTKITGMYPLIGAILAVLELGLGYWFIKAADRTERIVAGALMVVSLLTFLLMVVYWNLKKGEEGVEATTPGIGKLNLPEKQATADQIAEQLKSPEPEYYVGPNGSYIINRPPDDWAIFQLSEKQMGLHGLGLTNSPLAETFLGQADESESEDPKNIVIFETKDVTSVIPIPGVSTFDGRKLLTALEIQIPTRLTIYPLDRAQPPLFCQRPLIHNFNLAVSGVLGLGVVTLQKQWSSTVANTKRQRLVAELSQVVDNAIVNGQEGRSVASNVIVVGIEGDIQDYVLLMAYASVKDNGDPELSQKQQTLNSLMNSFRSIKVPNADALVMEFNERADQNFENMMKSSGGELFSTEFKFCIYKLTGKDFSKLDELVQATKLLKPFKLVAEKINYHDDQLDELWKSLEEAEAGNTSHFKEELEARIKRVGDEAKASARQAMLAASDVDDEVDDVRTEESS